MSVVIKKTIILGLMPVTSKLNFLVSLYALHILENTYTFLF